MVEGFLAKRMVKRYEMQLAAEPEKVFPLLCPVREYEWIEPWRCDLVHSESGYAELDCVFKTAFPGDRPEDVWVVSRFEPPGQIQFVRINPIRAMRYSITLEANGDGTTTALWEQVITGLSPEGNALLESLSDERYRSEKKALELMLNHYLGTGSMLPLDRVMHQLGAPAPGK
jgi:hypothetical protein